MPKSSNQKLKLLYLAKIFMENTDATHALTVKELSEALAAYEISAERKTVASNALTKEIGGKGALKEHRFPTERALKAKKTPLGAPR